MLDVENVVIFFIFFEVFSVFLVLEEVGVGTDGFGLVSHFNEIIIQGSID